MATTKINYKSDFKLLVGFKLNQEDIAVPNNDFTLAFRSERGGMVYRCMRRGDSFVNCRVQDNKVLCLFDNHQLWQGRLTVEYIDDSPDAEMPDGILTTVTPSSLDVELISGAGDGTEVTAEVAMDIATAVAQANAAAERAEDAAERAEQATGFYTREETDALLATKANKNGDGNEDFNANELILKNFALVKSGIGNQDLKIRHRGNDSAFISISPSSPRFAIGLDSGGQIVSPNIGGTMALTSDIPTNVSDLTNDLGFVTSQDIAPFVATLTLQSQQGAFVGTSDKTSTEIAAAANVGHPCYAIATIGGDTMKIALTMVADDSNKTCLFVYTDRTAKETLLVVDSNNAYGLVLQLATSNDLSSKADASSVYTKSQVDTALAAKAAKNGNINEAFSAEHLDINGWRIVDQSGDGRRMEIKQTGYQDNPTRFAVEEGFVEIVNGNNIIQTPTNASGTIALTSDIPTNVSAFNNDAGYLTQHQDISGKADVVQMVTDSTAREDETLTLAANTFYKWSGGWSGTITLSLTAASSGLSVWAGKFLCNDASLSLSVSPAVEVVDVPTFKSGTWYEWNIVDGVMLLKDIGEEVSNG